MTLTLDRQGTSYTLVTEGKGKADTRTVQSLLLPVTGNQETLLKSRNDQWMGAPPFSAQNVSLGAQQLGLRGHSASWSPHPCPVLRAEPFISFSEMRKLGLRGARAPS